MQMKGQEKYYRQNSGHPDYIKEARLALQVNTRAGQLFVKFMSKLTHNNFFLS
jgi:hypothetical protein